jgi:hypothetical protein
VGLLECGLVLVIGPTLYTDGLFGLCGPEWLVALFGCEVQMMFGMLEDCPPYGLFIEKSTGAERLSLQKAFAEWRLRNMGPLTEISTWPTMSELLKGE